MSKRITLAALALALIVATGCGSGKGNSKNSKVNTIVEKTGVASQYRKTRKIVKELEGEWTVLTVAGKKVTMDEPPYLIFETGSGRLYGSLGCNVVNGQFTSAAESKGLHFDELISGNAACAFSRTETQIANALKQTYQYSIANADGDDQAILTLKSKSGSALMTLKQHSLSVVNGAWTVTEIDGTRLNDESVRIVIDVQERHLHGNAGCNLINGEVVLDANKDNCLQFAGITATKKACPDLTTQTALLVALEEVEYYKKRNSSEIELLDVNRRPLVLLRRLPLMK